MDFKKVCQKLLYPPAWVVIILTVLSAAGLCAVFVKGLDTHPAAYALYVVSFYTVSVLTLVCIKVIPDCYRSIKRLVYSNKYGNRYMTDAAFKTDVSLHMSFVINILYAATNLFGGIIYSSVWSITLAAYYAILAVMRFLLIRFSGRVGIGKDRVGELRRSKLCGIILMTVNLALSGVVALVVAHNEGFRYNGILIYVMAMYTFFITTTAVINIFKYRKYNSPIMSTAKNINLAAALVSMLSLETAMLSEFGGENNVPHFNQIMVGATGACVCALVLTVSVLTIAGANRELKSRTQKEYRAHGK